ncbi:unnamed protein product, partial [Hapterophycus canaliculatus]
MTRAKARLFLSWRQRRMIFGQPSGGAKTVDADRSRFLDDIPPSIVRTIDKTMKGGGGTGYGGKGAEFGGGGGSERGRTEGSQ